MSAAHQSGAQEHQHSADPATRYRAVLDQYCVICHNTAAKIGELALDQVDLNNVAEHAPVLEKVVMKLRGNAMPPVGLLRPEPEVYDGLAEWLESELDRAAAANPNPGRPALYRLNRTEYKTVVRDLLSLDVDVAALLPPDDSSYGFDNVADVLSVSPALLEGYLAAADRVSALAVGDPQFAPEETNYRVKSTLSQDEYIAGLPIGTRGGILIEHNFPLDALYEINTTFLGNSVDGIRGLQFPHQFEIAIDGERVKMVTLGGQADYMQMLENTAASNETIANRTRVRVPLKAGVHKVTVTFIEKTGAIAVDQLEPFEQVNFDPVDLGGIPSVANVMIRGPFNGAAPSAETASRKAIFSCRPAEPNDEHYCADEILSRLARRAYRRPLTEQDNEMLRDFYDLGKDASGTFEGGIQMGIRRILASPEFMFRVERDPDDAKPGESYRISDLELASRLSFFLWSSTPDDQLVDLASRRKLGDPAVLEQQVRRMLGDPRSRALVDNFAAQWLHLRNLDSAAPDAIAFPDFDDNLRRAFLQETTLFVESIMREDRNVVDLLNADYTFLNERLARHYGVRGVYGDDFRRVTVADEARRGLLGHGSVLTVTSFPHRTSPVVRGKWVLENIVGTPPPAPPDDVPALTENAPDSLDHQTMRARLQQHRADPNCAVCHNIMDPIGFALEKFDGIGRWRDHDEAGEPIDASGELASGIPIDGPVELRKALIASPERFVETFAEKLLTYAIGRGLEHYDMPAVREIVAGSADDDYRFSALVLEVVESAPFQMKRAGSDPERVAAAQQ